MQSLFWFLVWLLFFGGVSTPVGGPPSAGDAILLNYGETAPAAGGAVAITFVGVVEDSRCPAEVTCVWAGRVVVALEVAVEGQVPQSIELGGATDSRGVIAGLDVAGEPRGTAMVAGHAVQLLAVTPYPTTAEPPANAEYQVALAVRQGADAP